MKTGNHGRLVALVLIVVVPLACGGQGDPREPPGAADTVNTPEVPDNPELPPNRYDVTLLDGESTGDGAAETGGETGAELPATDGDQPDEDSGIDNPGDTDDSGDTSAPQDTGSQHPAPAPEGCVTSVATGHQRFPCQGLVHDVNVPEQCVSEPCGLVVDIHGLTMSANLQEENTHLRTIGARHGYIVVQPNANPAPPMSSWKTGEDDARILAFLDDVQAAWHVDPRRIHVTGFSQGGLMTWRFLCRHADRFASAAPGASCNYPTQVACTFTGSDMPSRRIPILYMHGKDDILYFYESAKAQRDLVIRSWDLEFDTTVSSDGNHSLDRYVGKDGAVFEFLWHNYRAASDALRGHCYPGGSDKGDDPGQLFSYSCKGTNAFAWGKQVMRFFQEHPMD
jgi:polyhydroxybutyrate depolymerase